MPAIVERGDGGMVQRGEDLPLGAESREEVEGVQPAPEHFERDSLPERAVHAVGTVDGAHAAAPEQPDDLVRPDAAPDLVLCFGLAQVVRQPGEQRPGERGRGTSKDAVGFVVEGEEGVDLVADVGSEGGAGVGTLGAGKIEEAVESSGDLGPPVGGCRHGGWGLFSLAMSRREGPPLRRLHLAREPEACLLPLALDRARAEVQRLGGLLHGQPSEEAALHDARRAPVHLAKPVERLIERENLGSALFFRQPVHALVQRDVERAAAAFFC